MLPTKGTYSLIIPLPKLTWHPSCTGRLWPWAISHFHSRNDSRVQIRSSQSNTWSVGTQCCTADCLEGGWSGWSWFHDVLQPTFGRLMLMKVGCLHLRRLRLDGCCFPCGYFDHPLQLRRIQNSWKTSIVEVNENYIKPITAAAGKMSWALMMNPEGLDSDLFITPLNGCSRVLTLCWVHERTGHTGIQKRDVLG